MKKLFVIFIIILIPLTTLAQEKMLSNINNQINSKIQKMTKPELNSKVVNEWGKKELKFLELKNGTLIPMSVDKSNSLLEKEDSQKTEWWIYVLIITGIVVVVLIVFYIFIAAVFVKTTKSIFHN